MIRFVRICILLLSITVVAACASIAPLASSSSGGPRTLVLDGKRVSASDVGGFTSWLCVDYSDEYSIRVEVGYFESPGSADDTGFVLYDGGYTGKFASYSRSGLQRRWDWGLDTNGSYKYSIVIKSDGTALYYDFTTTVDGHSTKANEVYKSVRRKSPADIPSPK